MTDPLLGDRVRLDSLSEEDLGTIAAWRKDGEFLRMFQAEPAHPEMPARLVPPRPKDPNAFLFAVRTLSDKRLIGYGELDGILWSHGSGWVAIGIGGREDRGQGYGFEAMQLLLDFAFGELNLRRISLTVFSYNEPAIRLYERLGFVREGTYREFLVRDGEVYDMYLFGMLRREWRTPSAR